VTGKETPVHRDELKQIDLFGGLDDTQLDDLVRIGTEVVVEPGEEVFHEGEHADSWWVLLEGSLALVRRVGREDVVVGRMDAPGRWAGGFRAWDEQGVYLATARGERRGRVLRIPAEALRERLQAWFPFGVHLIAGLYRTARSIESTARQRDSLVTLGTLAAGLAHELNNPAAAAGRAVTALGEACESLLSSLGRLAEGDVSAAQFSRLDALRRELDRPAGRPDALALADREADLSEWLEERDVTQAWSVAPALAAAGADVSWCDRAATALPGGALEPGLVWIASTLSARALLGEVGEANRRISELVASVRSYTQLDRASRQRTDVIEGIESTLVMLGHELRDGVVVQRDYAEDVPEIEAYAGELNQVWTNLVDNAVEAMGGEGTLRVVVRHDADAVVVEIGDSGPGMEADVAARAFEAFFTTKEVGRGTGLGLDIARRIVVERHGGEIDIESTPGDTVLRVRLPR
jgi:signal transduction histidine kinase